MRYQAFPPHPRLAHLLMHILVFELDGCESHLPAALSPALMLFVRGGVQTIAPDGARNRHPRFTLIGPSMHSRHSFADPGTLAISMMFRPDLLQPALNVPPMDILAGYVQMRDIADQESVDRLLGALDEDRPITEYVRLFQEFLLSTLDVDYRESIGAAFIAARHKMFLPVVDIAMHFGVGERQLERRVRQVFGLPLREVRRISRFGLALPRLLHHVVEWGDLTRIAQEAGYYDQAHMHREFIDMSGFPPFHLLKKVTSNDPAFWIYRIRPDDFKKLFLPMWRIHTIIINSASLNSSALTPLEKPHGKHQPGRWQYHSHPPGSSFRLGTE